jgi:hypothetical protein
LLDDAVKVREMRAARVLIALSACALLVAASDGTAAGEQNWTSAELLVSPVRSEYPHLDITLSFASERGDPGRITLYTPRGAALYAQRPLGSPIGDADIFAASNAYGAGATSQLYGTIVAAPDDQTVQACSPGEHLAAWRIDLSLLGQQLHIPIAISRTGPNDPPDAALKLELCPPALPAQDGGTAGTLPLAELRLTLEDVVAPPQRGQHLWRALVTPLAIDEHTPLPGATYELRGRTPAPNTLTLQGRYDPKTRQVILRGQLKAAGTPRPRVALTLIRLSRRISPKRISFDDRIVGQAVSNAGGAFRFRSPINSTTSFTVFAHPHSGKCTGPTTAPAGCLSDSIAGIQSEPITLSPRRP